MLELARGRHEALGSLYSRHSRLVFYLALQSLERPAAEELVLQGDQWTSLGTFMPDADGTARVIADNSVLASSPNSVEITVESAGGSQAPSDTVVLRWPPA